MPSAPATSPFRLDKRRVEATLTLTTGRTIRGSFFLGETTMVGDGPERVDDLLNHTTGFFPFERLDNDQHRVVLYNTAHVTLVTLFGKEAREVPGWEVAQVRYVSLILSGGEQVSGHVRVHQPDGRNRVSDWSHEPTVFRYVEITGSTLLVNINHVVEIIEREQRP